MTTLLPKRLKPRAALMMAIGQNAGIWVSYNLFVPLNSETWLNQNISSSITVNISLIKETFG